MFGKHLFLLLTLSLPFLSEIAVTNPVGIVTESDRSVYRAFEANSLLGARTQWGTAYYLEFIGERFSTEDEAVDGYDFFVEYLPSTLPSVIEEILTERIPNASISVNQPSLDKAPILGDQSFALSIEADISMLASESLGWLVVRQGRNVLTATVASNVGYIDYVALLASIVEPTLERWDLNDSVDVDASGIRSGGIWNLVPGPDEVPDGFVLDVTYEEGPGLTPKIQSLPTLSGKSQRGKEESRTNSDTGDRLAEPFDVALRIILPNSTFEALPDGTCSGVQDFSWMTNGQFLALRTGDRTQIVALSSQLESGLLSYDLELEEDVCVFDVIFENVPPRSRYVLSSYGTNLGAFEIDELNSGNIVEVVIRE